MYITRWKDIWDLSQNQATKLLLQLATGHPSPPVWVFSVHETP